MAVVLAGPAQAATFTVTTTDDEQNADAQCSLREAVINADEHDQSGSADCAAGVGEDTMNFDLEGSSATVTLASQLPTITDSAQLTIGGGSTNITASGNEQVSMREVSTDTTTLKIFKAGENSARKATVTYEEVSDKATLDPSAELRRGDSYRVVVNRGARDEAGNRLDQDQDPSNGHQRKVWRLKVRN
jgi:CSLREA domain-containing protein